MDKLLRYLNSLSKVDRATFAEACGSTEGYLRKAVSKGQVLGGPLCILIEKNSGGLVVCEDLDPTADWDYIRATAKLAANHVPEPTPS